MSNSAATNTGTSESTHAPVGQLNVNRGLVKFILLTIVTFGIYPIVFYSGISNDINTIANRYEGKKTMNYALLFFIIAPLTFGIGYFVWFNNVSARIGNELKRRNLNYSFSAGTFWLWNVLGMAIVVGPFVYAGKMCNAMNKLAADYNLNG